MAGSGTNHNDWVVFLLGLVSAATLLATFLYALSSGDKAAAIMATAAVAGVVALLATQFLS